MIRPRRGDRRLTCRFICTSAYSSCMKLREPYTRERDNEKPGGGLFGLDHLERHSRFSRHRTFARYVHTFYGVCADNRSEEHTSELQSLMRISYAVFCLKKKNKYTQQERQET